MAGKEQAKSGSPTWEPLYLGSSFSSISMYSGSPGDRDIIFFLFFVFALYTFFLMAETDL